MSLLRGEMSDVASRRSLETAKRYAKAIAEIRKPTIKFVEGVKKMSEIENTLTELADKMKTTDERAEAVKKMYADIVRPLETKDDDEELASFEIKSGKRWPACNDIGLQMTLDWVIDEMRGALESGQKEYAHDENIFANFNRIANELRTTPEKVLMVYAMKHVDGIVAWVNGHRSQREDVGGRINDLIVYMVLLWAMVESYEHETMSISPTGLE